MAKNIYICSRQKLPVSTENRLHEICKNLAPNNIATAAPKVVVNGDIAYGIMNPGRTLTERGSSLLMGQIFGENNKWDEPSANFRMDRMLFFAMGRNIVK